MLPDQTRLTQSFNVVYHCRCSPAMALLQFFLLSTMVVIAFGQYNTGNMIYNTGRYGQYTNMVNTQYNPYLLNRLQSYPVSRMVAQSAQTARMTSRYSPMPTYGYNYGQNFYNAYRTQGGNGDGGDSQTDNSFLPYLMMTNGNDNMWPMMAMMGGGQDMDPVMTTMMAMHHDFI